MLELSASKWTTGEARNYNWRGEWKNLWRYFDDVFRWRNDVDVTKATS